MKIGITCYPTYGGSGVVATELGKELAARGHDVHFISYALPIRLTSFRLSVRFPLSPISWIATCIDDPRTHSFANDSQIRMKEFSFTSPIFGRANAWIM